MAKKIARVFLIAILLVLGFTDLLSQTTLVNYDFNSMSSYPVAPTTTTTNVSSSLTSTEAFTSFAGAATTAGAFTQNSTSGQAIAMNNSSGTNTKYFTFSLSGSALVNYKTLKIYFQAQRSNTGAQLVTVQYSLNGGAYTTFASNTMSPGNGGFNATTIALPSAVDNPTTLDIRLFASGASTTGTLRVDNFQVQGVLSPIAPSFNIANNGLQPNAATILQNSNDNILQRFTITEGNVAAGTLSSISIPLAGTYSASDIDALGLKLYAGTTNSFASATVISSKTSASSGSGETITFSSLNYAIAKNATRYFWITADVAAAAVAGRTIRASALTTSNVTFASGSETGSVSAGGIQTIAALLASLSINDNGMQPAAASVLQNTANHILQSFTLAEGNVAAATLSAVAIPLAGSYAAADINGAGLKLYASTTNNFASASVVSFVASAASGSGENALFNGLNYAVAKNSTHYFWITADIANSATVGHTINASALSAGNFTFATASVTAAVNAGGIQTIDAPPVTTQLRTSYCGYQAESFGEFIGADSVLTANHYRFLLVNAAQSYTQTFTNSSGYPYLTLYTIPGISYNTTYTVTVAWSTDSITWSPYGSPCSITSPTAEVTELQPAYCGYTASTYPEVIYANKVSGATQYEYKLVNTALGYSQTYVKTNNNFNLAQFTGLTNGATYSVSIRVYIFGAWDIYGTECSVTTPSVTPTTSLQPTSCGITISTYPQVLYAEYVGAATQYEYQVSNTALGYSQTLLKANNNFNLGQFTGLSNGTTYSVSVRAKVNNVWGTFGPSCSVTTPIVLPTTSLQPTYCGITATAYTQVLYADYVSAASQYEYRLVNTALGYSQTYVKTNNNFNLSQFTGLTNGATYSVSIRLNINNSWGNYGPVCQVTTPSGVPTTSLQAAYCGITVSNYPQVLYAEYIGAATQYEYRLVNTALGYSQTYVKTNNNFNLSQFTGLTHGTTYSVSVRANVNNTWGSFGPVCQVTTPSGVSTSSLQPSYCGITATAFTQVLYADAISGATQYEYKLENAALGYSQTYVKTNNNFNLSQFTGLATSTAYSVSLRVNVNNTWSNYGPVCQVTTPSAVPVTSLQPAYCGITATAYNQVLYATAVAGATQYEYRLENAALGYSQSYVKLNNNFNLTQLSGLTNSSSYSVSIRVNISGIWGAYGSACTVTTPASAIIVNGSTGSEASSVAQRAGVENENKEEGTFDVLAYPNPYDSRFAITLLNYQVNESITIRVYDATGKPIEEYTASPETIRELEIGTDYAKGLYHVLISQGATTRALKIIRQ